MSALGRRLRRISRTAIVVATLATSTTTLAFADEVSPTDTSTKPTATPAVLVPSIEVFAQYAYRRTNSDGGSSSWFHQFDVPRAHLGITAEKEHVHGRVLLEGVRSASEGALVGVAGDSVLVRFRQAWGGARFASIFDVRAGIVPTWFIDTVDGASRTRVLLPSALESTQWSSPADLGFQLRAALPGGLGHAGISIFNGEGYEQRELNRGKSTELAATIHPLAFIHGAEPFAVMLGYVKGSVGTGSARADRVVAGLLFSEDRFAATVDCAYALGVLDDGARRGWLIEASLRVEPVDCLLLAARGASLVRDTAHSGDSLRTFVLAAGYRVDEGVEGWLSLLRSSAGSILRVAQPASDFTEVRVSGRFAF